LGLDFKRAPHMGEKKKKGTKNTGTLYLPHRCVRPCPSIHPSIHISTRLDSPPARLVSCEHRKSKAAAASSTWQTTTAPHASVVRVRVELSFVLWRHGKQLWLRQQGASKTSGGSSSTAHPRRATAPAAPRHMQAKAMAAAARAATPVAPVR
jgi:hypothetical protein